MRIFDTLLLGFYAPSIHSNNQSLCAIQRVESLVGVIVLHIFCGICCSICYFVLFTLYCFCVCLCSLFLLSFSKEYGGDKVAKHISIVSA